MNYFYRNLVNTKVKAFHTTGELSFNHIVNSGRIVPCVQLPDSEETLPENHYCYLSLFEPMIGEKYDIGDRGFVFDAYAIIARGGELIPDCYHSGRTLEDEILSSTQSKKKLDELQKSYPHVQNTWQIRYPWSIQLDWALGQFKQGETIVPFDLKDYEYRSRKLISTGCSFEIHSCLLYTSPSPRD